MPSSAGSVATSLADPRSGDRVAASGGSTNSIGSATAGIKRHLQTAEVGGSSGGSGSASVEDAAAAPVPAAAQGGKKQKVARDKEKVSLQERMRRLGEHYSAKKSKAQQLGAGTTSSTGLGAGRTNIAAIAAATPVAAMSSCSLTVAPVVAAPAASLHVVQPTPAATPSSPSSLYLAPADASPADLLADSLEADKRRSGHATEGAVLGAAVASGVSNPVKKPSNMISGLHSLTSLLGNKKDQSAPAVGKWDRLAAGGGAPTRAVPALRKAEEARALEERRTRERAAARSRTAAAVAAAAAAASASVSSGELSDSSTSSTSNPLLAPLRKTGMLAKLVPNAAVDKGTNPKPTAGNTLASTSAVLPAPFRSHGGGATVLMEDSTTSGLDGADARGMSCASATSTISVASGFGIGTTTSSSDKIEMKIRDQRAQTAMKQMAIKRNARMEKLKAEEDKKKV